MTESDTNMMTSSVQRAGGLLKSGRLDDAWALAEAALESAGTAEKAGLHNVLGLILYRRKKAHDALMQFSQALALDSANAAFLINAAGAMRALGRLREAADALSQTVSLAPDNMEARRGLVSLLRRLGNLDRAEDIAVETVERFPDRVDSHLIMGRVAQARGEVKDAIAAFEEALDLDPDHTGALTALGHLHIELHHLPQAVDLLTRATQADAAAVEPYILLGKAQMRAGEVEASEASLRHAVGLDETAAEAWMGLASLFMKVGKTAEAVDALKIVIKHQPDHPHALYQLAMHGEALDAEKILSYADKRASTPLVKRYYLSTAGELAMARSEAEQAFELFAQANALRREELADKGLSFDADAHARAVGEVIEACPQGSFSDLHGGVMSETPVFLVGVPQSGVRVLGKLLDTHPDIFVMGENSNVAKMAASVGFPQKQDKLNPLATKSMAKEYLETLEKAHPGKRRIVDASPSNFMWLGLIARLYPRARIIHVQRNAVDCCLWSYIRNLGQHRAYSHDLVEMGRYYVEYERLIAYWQALLPNPVLQVRLEEFADKPETVLRRVLKFLGVLWRRECVPNQHDLDTVRSSIGRWKDFDAHLGPLKMALAGEFEPEPSEDLAAALAAIAPEPGDAPTPAPAPAPELMDEVIAEEDVLGETLETVPAEPVVDSGLAALAAHLGNALDDESVESAPRRSVLDAPPPSDLSENARARIDGEESKDAAWSLAHLVDLGEQPTPVDDDGTEADETLELIDEDEIPAETAVTDAATVGEAEPVPEPDAEESVEAAKDDDWDIGVEPIADGMLGTLAAAPVQASAKPASASAPAPQPAPAPEVPAPAVPATDAELVAGNTARVRLEDSIGRALGFRG